MAEKREPGSFDPGDPYGLRLVRRSILWLAGIMGFWATLRVVMLASNYETYYLVAIVLLLIAVLLEPVVHQLRRRREPF